MKLEKFITVLEFMLTVENQLPETEELVNECKKLIEENGIYRRAIEMACEEQSELQCCRGHITRECDKACNKHWADYYIQKAREQK